MFCWTVIKIKKNNSKNYIFQNRQPFRRVYPFENQNLSKFNARRSINRFSIVLNAKAHRWALTPLTAHDLIGFRLIFRGRFTRRSRKAFARSSLGCETLAFVWSIHRVRNSPNAKRRASTMLPVNEYIMEHINTHTCLHFKRLTLPGTLTVGQNANTMCTYYSGIRHTETTTELSKRSRQVWNYSVFKTFSPHLRKRTMSGYEQDNCFNVPNAYTILHVLRIYKIVILKYTVHECEIIIILTIITMDRI